jgi:hypothetical protein
MSLSTRGIAALGTVLVIGAATVGFSVKTAHDGDKPINRQVTLTAGGSSKASEPICWNHGKVFDTKTQLACQNKVPDLVRKGKLPTLTVGVGDRIGVGVDPKIADVGWYAFTNAGNSRQTVLASARRHSTYSGSVAAPTVLTTDEETVVTVVESDTRVSDRIYGVWYFILKNKDV